MENGFAGRNVLFLDVDGVLNTAADIGSMVIRPAAVSVLKRIVQEWNFVIVLTSS